MNEYPLGQEVEITMEFRDGSDALHDPASATLDILHPDKTTKDTKALADFTRVSAGLYTYSFIPNDVGRWRYYGVGVGSEQVAATGHFLVTDSGV